MNRVNRVFFDIIEHEILGVIYVYWDEQDRIVGVSIRTTMFDMMSEKACFDSKFPKLHKYLKNYGTSDLPDFDINILDLGRYSDFQKNVYKTLITVPRGMKITYSELSFMAGYPRAFRAVGTAMKKNHHLLLIPCHRVVAVDGIGGFACGLDIKISLLKMEGITYT